MKKTKPKNQTKTLTVTGFKGVDAKFNGTYEERAGAMNREAMEKEFEFAAQKIAEAKGECKDLAKINISAANKCREAGISLITLNGGRETISMDFWIKNDCAKKLGIGYELAKWFIFIAKKYPEKIKTLKEAAPVYLQCLFACGQLEMPERSGEQNSVSVSAFQKFLGEITIVRKDFEKAVRQAPMEKWKPELVDSFLKDTKWLADERSKAEALKNVTKA